MNKGGSDSLGVSGEGGNRKEQGSEQLKWEEGKNLGESESLCVNEQGRDGGEQGMI